VTGILQECRGLVPAMLPEFFPLQQPPSVLHTSLSCPCGAKCKNCAMILVVVTLPDGHMEYYRAKALGNTQMTTHHSSTCSSTLDESWVVTNDEGAVCLRDSCELTNAPVLAPSSLIRWLYTLPTGVFRHQPNFALSIPPVPRVTPFKCALCHERFFSRGSRRYRKRAAKCKGRHWSSNIQALVKCHAWVCRYDNECARAAEPCPVCSTVKPWEVLEDSLASICSTQEEAVPRWCIPTQALRYLYNGQYVARWINDV
jgi:hypothetical protein